MSFGQSFQITPIQMATIVSSWSMVEKESRRILEFPLKTEKETVLEQFQYEEKKGSYQKNFRNHADALKSVVEEGSGRNGAVERGILSEEKLHVPDTSKKCK